MTSVNFHPQEPSFGLFDIGEVYGHIGPSEPLLMPLGTTAHAQVAMQTCSSHGNDENHAISGHMTN